MNSREIVIANFTHQNPPRPGYAFGNERRNDMAMVGSPNPKGYEAKRWIEGAFEYYNDIWGNIWHRMVDGCRHGEVYRQAIIDWKDLEGFKLPEYDRAAAAEHYRQGFAKHPDRFRVVALPGWIFAQARYIRKMDNYLMDMLLYPEELHRLHSMMAKVYETLILAAGDAGADAIFFCEDMGTQTDVLFSPLMWDEYFKRLYSKLFGIAKENNIFVCMHSCGKNRKVLEPLLKSGVNCFQFDQPALYDFADLAVELKRFKAALWSPVDIQKVLPTGNRELIEAEVERMYKAFGGFMVFNSYSDLAGIGIKPVWDQWAYEKIISLNPEQ